MAIKAIIFDMDGCLVDSEPIIGGAAIKALSEWGVNATLPDFLPFVGTGEDSFIGGVAAKYGLKYEQKMKERTYFWYFQMIATSGKPFPGAVELLAKLREKGIPFAIASSADHEKVLANARAVGAPIEWYAAIVDGEMVTKKKPDPEIFFITARKLDVKPEECCVVEDAKHGVHAANAAGMRSVAVAHTLSAAELADADVVREKIGMVTFADLGLEG